MTPPLYIALRFLTHRKRALLLSLTGVVFGVGIFICTQAQTQGFAQYFIDSTIGSNGAYSAQVGWDACTGFGAPGGNSLMRALSGGAKNSAVVLAKSGDP